MRYKRLANGTHAVGVEHDGRFVIWTSVFDAREGRALVKAVDAVFDLFFATSGAYSTMVGDAEVPRGATAKVARAAAKAARAEGPRPSATRPTGSAARRGH